MAAPTAQEQYILELVNRARLNPLGEAQRYGIDLNQGLAAGTLTAAQKQPLAFNFQLNDSADAHSNWMLATDTFSHTGVNGSSPMQRMQTAGYSFTGNWWNGENIAYVGTTGTLNFNASMADLHRNLFLSAGHRENILNGAFRELGVGAQQGVFTSGGTNYNSAMLTENFATSGSNTFVTGVAYTDSNGDKLYSIGEGTGGVTATLKSGSSALASQVSWSAGGFALATSYQGGVTMEFSGAGLAQVVGASFYLNGENAKIDLVNGNIIKSSVSVQLAGAAVGLELLGINEIYGYGNELANTITGNSGNNTLHGFNGDDTLIGNDGDDILFGGAGADYLDGGSGQWDRAGYVTSSAAVTVSLTTGKGSAGDALGDTLVSIEIVGGSNFNDYLEGNAADNKLFGNDGDDILFGGAGADYLDGGSGQWDRAGYVTSSAAVTVSLTTGKGSAGDALGDTLVSIEIVGGSNFNDYLEGNAADNKLFGNGGDDILLGGAGADYLDGGDGQWDRAGYITSSSAVQVSLATGKGTSGDALGDTLVSIEIVGGSNFNDYLEGNAADNKLFGNGGDDILLGGAGADYLDGGDGQWDRAGYITSSSAVQVSLATGKGTSGDALGDTLVNIEIVGGSNFNDALEGNDQNNVLCGNGGDDILIGRGGADRFDFNSRAFGHDTISDFVDGSDTLAFMSGAATSLNDFAISGNGTTDVTLTCSSGSIVLHGAAAITITASDFLFL